MHRFYVPPGSIGDGLLLTDREAHHALDVLRLGVGDEVTTLDGRGKVRECLVSQCSRREVRLSLKSEVQAPPRPCAMSLIQAIPKGKTFETIIQKATELGATQIVPLITERVVVELDPDEIPRKLAKWEQVAIEAIKQCGTPWLPQIAEPVSLPQALERHLTHEFRLVASLLPDSQHPKHFFDAFHSAQHRAPKSAVVFVGPEGDFTPAEVASIVNRGVHPITLGPFVLRADTAAIYCLSVLSYEFFGRQALEAPRGVSVVSQ